MVAVCVVATALTASAQFSAGPNLPPGTTSFNSSVAQDPDALSETAWTFGTAGLPIVITQNPNAGVWEKVLSGAGQLDTFQEVNLREFIRVGAGSQQFSDWHETVTTPNFEWGFDADDTFYTINGGAQQFSGISFSPDFTSVSFTFPTLEPPGTVIFIHKELEYIGSDTFDNNLNAITVDEYPTVPEPSTLALLGLGALGVLVSRRRK